MFFLVNCHSYLRLNGFAIFMRYFQSSAVDESYQSVKEASLGDLYFYVYFWLQRFVVIDCLCLF